METDGGGGTSEEGKRQTNITICRGRHRSKDGETEVDEIHVLKFMSASLCRPQWVYIRVDMS